MHIHELYPSKWVKAYDLKNKQVTVTIKALAVEEVGAQGEKKPVLWFEGASKGLILNKTCALAIARLHGPDTDAWAGKPVTLYPTQVNAFGQTHDVVRVADRLPANGHTNGHSN